MKSHIEQLLAFPLRRFLAPMLSLVAAAPLALTPFAQGQTAGRLLFLNPQTGAYQVGGIDIGGYFHAAASGTRPKLAGTTNIVPNNTAIIAYNQNSGYSEFAVVDGFGNVAFNPQQLGAGYPYIVGTGGNFFFYNGNANQNGAGVLITLNQSGTYNRQLWSETLSPWSIIVQSDNYLNFYNMTTGLFDQAASSQALNQPIGELLQDSSSVVTLASGYGVMAPINDNLILYNTGTGAYNVLGLYFTGNGKDFPDSRSKGMLKKYYDTILPIAGQVLFYGYGTGDALTGYLNQTAQLVTENDTTLPIYTDLVVDETYIVGYVASTGKLDVYSISTGGVLTLHSTTTIAAGFSMVVTQS
jgi:hypothetical protein